MPDFGVWVRVQTHCVRPRTLGETLTASTVRLQLSSVTKSPCVML